MIHLHLQGKSHQDQYSDHKASDKYCIEAKADGAASEKEIRTKEAVDVSSGEQEAELRPRRAVKKGGAS